MSIYRRRRHAITAENDQAAEPGVLGNGSADLLLRCVDAGLAVSIFIVPYILGGRLAFGHLVLTAAAIFSAICWCLRQSRTARATWVRSPAEWLLLAALILVGLQVIPLPPAVINALSPHIRELLPLWSPDADSVGMFGTWETLSLTPAATRDGTIVLSAFGLLLLVTIQRVQQVQDVERLLRWVAISTVVMAVFALEQYRTANGKFGWFYEYPLTNTSKAIIGGFTNRNHFAQYMALGIGPLIWWLYYGLQRRDGAKAGQFGKRSLMLDPKVSLVGVALAFCVFMGFLSMSRGGALSLATAAAVCLIVLATRRLISWRTIAGIAGVALLALVCLLIYGYDEVCARLDTFESIDRLDKTHTRRLLWQADGKAIQDFPLIGTGLASHREICPTYLPDVRNSQSLDYTHAESGYIQAPLETGLPGLLLVVVAMALSVSWCVSLLRRGVAVNVLLAVAAISASLAASFIHSLVDFVWYVPGCMIAMVVLAACACRLGQLHRGRMGRPAAQVTVPRLGWLAAAVCLLVTGFFMLENRAKATMAELAWHRYLILNRDLDELEGSARHVRLRELADELSSVVAWQPDHARAHARLAGVHLELFSPPDDSGVIGMDASQVCDAMLAKPFATSKELHAWLATAFGQQSRHLTLAYNHARRAVALCPLQGEVYLCLANLCFLEGPDSPGRAGYVGQALAVRPFDGAVLFVAGKQAALAGRLDLAIRYRQASFRAGALHQERILEELAKAWPPVPAQALLDTFQPDIDALGRMVEFYEKSELQEQLSVLLRRYAEMLEARARKTDGPSAVEDWIAAAKAYQKLDDSAERLRCLRQAVECRPSHFDARYALGTCLYDIEQYVEAEQHLTWCFQRKPEDKHLRRLVKMVVDRRLRLTRRAGAPTGPH